MERIVPGIRKMPKVKIETTEKNNKLFISVKDYGIGIPKDSINLVWDRFYKTDLSRGKDKTGSGLGLSIVKSILDLHKAAYGFEFKDKTLIFTAKF